VAQETKIGLKSGWVILVVFPVKPGMFFV